MLAISGLELKLPLSIVVKSTHNHWMLYFLSTILLVKDTVILCACLQYIASLFAWLLNLMTFFYMNGSMKVLYRWHINHSNLIIS